MSNFSPSSTTSFAIHTIVAVQVHGPEAYASCLSLMPEAVSPTLEPLLVAGPAAAQQDYPTAGVPAMLQPS